MEVFYKGTEGIHVIYFYTRAVDCYTGCVALIVENVVREVFCKGTE